MPVYYKNCDNLLTVIRIPKYLLNNIHLKAENSFSIKKCLRVAFLFFFGIWSFSGLRAQSNYEAVTYGNGQFIAVASNGEVITSPDGITWESASAPTGSWQDIVYGNNLYVVVGNSSAMTSPDGINWTQATVPSGDWRAVVYNNSLYVASATWGSNYVMTSPDGINWIARTPAYTWSHDDLAFGNIGGTDRFVAVCQFGRGWVASDPTGTWSQINPGAIVDIRAITFGNGKFVWLQWGGSGNVYAGVSTNGTSFTPYISGVINNWNSLVYGNGTYVAVASGGSNTRAAYSTNGQSWTYGSGVETNSWQSVAYGNNTFVAVGNSGANRIMYSTDGITWNHDAQFLVTNTDPTISAVSNLTTCPDMISPDISVTIDDVETAAADLTLSVASDNPTLLPIANIELSGSGTARNVVLHPVSGETGTATLILTVADEEGATAESTFTVLVEDNTAPTVFTRDITVQLDENGQAEITPDMVNDGSSDNCAIASLSLDTSSFDCDDAGGVLQAPETIIEQLDSGFGGGGNTHWQSFTATGDIYLTSIEVNHSFPNTIQNTEVFLELYRGEGISGTKIANSLNTNEGTAGAGSFWNYTFDNIPLEDGQVYTWHIYFSTAQDIGWISFAGDNPYVGGRGEYCCGNLTDDFVFRVNAAEKAPATVSLTVTDLQGNSSSASAIVTIEDQTAPIVVTRDITVLLKENGQAEITPEMVNDGSSDNCGIASMSLDITSFDCESDPETPVNLTLTDIHGNSATATATITVQDSEAPAVITRDITIQLDENGQATINPAMVDNGSTDNCAIESLSLDISSFDCESDAITSVTLMATDIHGNSATATATITVQDSQLPAVVTRDITIQLDENGQATITPAMVDNGSTDNCTIESLSLDISSFDCGSQETTSVTLTATDIHGNSSSAVALVTMEENSAPQLVTRDIVIQLNESGQAVITPSMVDNGSTDNCAIVNFSLDTTEFTCSDTGVQIVNLTAIDANGNEAVAVILVTVEDHNHDQDGEAISDSCDSDDDNDGIPDMEDEDLLDPDQGMPEPDVDDEEEEPITDDDLDGIINSVDNCAQIPNSGQEDRDGDGLGDACDTVELNVSQAFTPNGDGINDTWNIYNIKQYTNSLVRVFNQYGNEVFSARNYQNDWDGSYKVRSEKLPGAGSYYFQIDLEGDGSVDQEGWLYLNSN